MKAKVLIGMPVGRDRKADAEAVKVCCSWGHEFIFEPSYSPALGRNRIITLALIDPAITHVFFCDSDTVPPLNALNELLADDKDVVAAVVPIRQQGKVYWNAVKSTVSWIPYNELPSQLFTAYQVGAAAILIRRNVFERLSYPYFQFSETADRVLTTDDQYFCECLRKAAIPIWCDPSVKCSHWKLQNLHS